MYQYKIISVDDTLMNLILIEEIAKEIGVAIQSFQDPLEALEYIRQNRVDLMFVDYMMPDINGVALIKEALALQEELIPIMVTAVDDDQDLKLEALEAGATDFLTKPVDVAQLEAKIKNFTKIIQLKLQLQNFNARLQEEVQKATADLVEREHEALEVISRLAEYRDPETGSHISRVAHYSRLLAKEYGLSEQEQDILFFASPLHDIGKVGIRDDILLKPAKLEEDEYIIMKTHSSIGHDILKDSKNPYLQAGATIAKHHHEKYDGSGYYNGLKGEEIHIYGRITAIADVFDALTSERPYKKPWSFEDTVEFLKNESGKHFDPKLVALFILNIDKIKEIYLQFEA
ncbi:MAG: HD domain-containing phosphohydrolase [Sulfurimonas sp.]|jgi:response regulator RpfG family c-di-GMP phosphodiesterase